MQLALPFSADAEDFSTICQGRENGDEGGRRGLSGAQLASVLTALRGGNLLVASLMLGCGMSFNQVISMEVTDISLTTGTVRFTGSFGDRRTADIPGVVIEDLKEFLLDRQCGRDARVNTSDSPKVFLSEGHEAKEEAKEYETAIKNAIALASRSRAISTDLLLWARSEFTLCCEQWECSPLDLFEKGPMIVRRTSASDRSTTDRYYLWRYRGLPAVRKERGFSARSVRKPQRLGRDNRRTQHQLQAAA